MDRPANGVERPLARCADERGGAPAAWKDAPAAALRGCAVLLLATIVACDVVERDRAEAGAELLPPVVRIVAADGAQRVADVSSAVTVDGSIELVVEALPWMTAVTFRWLDGTASLHVAAEPFALTLDTRDLADGEHVIHIELHERSGQVRMEVEVPVRVSNDAPVSDPPVSDPPVSDPPVSDPPAACTQPLSWAPPALDDPITVHVPDTGGVMTLDPDRDYRLVMPDGPVVNPLAINGGRNVVIIGGEIAIAWQGDDARTEARRRAFFIRNATGVVHVEGVLMHGEDIGEGIQISAPKAIVQIQNVRIWGIHARDAVDFSDGHPDLIQTWGNVGALRVDRLTGSSNYQGIFLKADFNGQHGPVDLRCVNVHGDPTSRYLFWMSRAGGAYPEVRLDDVFVDHAASRTMATAVWPDARHHAHPATIRLVDDRYEALWDSLPVTGHVSAGSPPNGDFVPAGAAGVGYASPGYADPSPRASARRSPAEAVQAALSGPMTSSPP